MKFSEANLGRIYILRLEHGDTIPTAIEEFARKQGIRSALVYFLGGAEKGSKVVVGPKDGITEKPIPMVTVLPGVSESLGFGTLFLNQDNCPKLHMHAAFGRENETITGCTREGVEIWQIGEVVVLELIESSARREINAKNGFELLEV